MEGDPAHGLFPVGTSPNESLGPAKILHLRRQFFHRFRGHACIKPVGLVPFSVQERLRPEDGMVGKSAATEDDRICPGETVFADLDRLRGLAPGVEINAVSEQLGTEPTDGGERADPDPGGAINKMPAADSGVLLNNHFRPAFRLVSEMPAAAPARKTCDPV